MIYDLAIIGGGPAGVAAGVYASRKRLKTVFITKDFGGQSVVSDGIENWIGTVKISGADLAKSLEDHLRSYAKDIVDIKTGELVTQVEKVEGTFRITTAQSSDTSTTTSYTAKTVLVTTGSSRKKLEVVGADVFEHKGLTYCATCDGPIFSGQDVVVIGGGNAGFESAAQLLAYAKSVTLIHRREEFRADPVTVKKVLSHPHMKAITNADPLEVTGDTFVSGLTYLDKNTNEKKTLAVSGIFVEIGSTPITYFVKDVVDLDEYGRIKIDPWTQATSTKGIWAAGDATNILYHQNNIAAGDAVRALEDIYVHLHTK